MQKRGKSTKDGLKRLTALWHEGKISALEYRRRASKPPPPRQVGLTGQRTGPAKSTTSTIHTPIKSPQVGCRESVSDPRTPPIERRPRRVAESESAFSQDAVRSKRLLASSPPARRRITLMSYRELLNERTLSENRRRNSRQHNRYSKAQNELSFADPSFCRANLWKVGQSAPSQNYSAGQWNFARCRLFCCL